MKIKYNSADIIYDKPKENTIYFINRKLCRKRVKEGGFKETGRAELKDGKEVIIYNGIWGYII